ncbi:MAG: hypothetical protein CFE43_12305, partial [Burkholderiales bacterium PBB3]
MTLDFLPIPTKLPPHPDGVEAMPGAQPPESGDVGPELGNLTNQRLGVRMFGRPDGATLTELWQACRALAGREMGSTTANQTKDKLKNHWRWIDDVTHSFRAERTGDERGGEPVYKLNRIAAGSMNKQPDTIDDASTAEINLDAPNMQPTNTILYGPPGTGKTFTTIDEAIKILDPEFYAKNESERESLKERFDDLVANNRIRFVTFHQSFSYEDFVEGLRAEADEAEGGQIQYVIEKGVFQAICEDASKPIQSATAKLGVSDSPRIWKISIDGTGDSATRQYCLEHGEARIGWGNVGNLKTAQLNDPSFTLGSNDRSTLELFGNEIAVGDVLLCIGSNTEVAAIGIVSGNYRYEATPPSSVRADYKNVLPVNWIVTDCNFSILNLNSQ